MSLSRTLARNLTWLSVLWMIITMSLVVWWWVHAVLEAGDELRLRRMFLWEGSFLLTILGAGGVCLVYLTYNHQRRHESLKNFFSTFAHDLKTSMTRLRLQAELLEESKSGLDPKVLAILKDVQKLDLQLENALWMSQIDSGALLLETTRLREVMDHLRNEFGEVTFEMSRDAELWVDHRAFTVVLRNLFHNSVLHGNASKIEIQLSGEGNLVRLIIGDNGGGLKGDIPAGLGHEVLSVKSHRRSTGLGLYLSRRLVERMGGKLDIQTSPRFSNVLTVKGRLA